MKYALIIALLFQNKVQFKARYLDKNSVLINGSQKFVQPSINFKKQPGVYLQTPKLRLDGLTRIEAVEKVFDYKEATTGTDVDLYTSIFIPASKKGTDRWMLVFDATTGRLMQVVYSKFSNGLTFFKP
ncbi:hypothetical protein BDD43_1742 [Mucilaginibacter gracilis]|uniref:Uncharacterized protein n=1 Tax=Mucilaginibacter gracilis TaxID=423350 RepID=A0A495IYK5_9SPHI|nr:hypothetical protein [Mucilaginibacter gracilis]RKR81593.1 hypothetical protein BDD43_1742 [Mucilaginibacter gracilis]